MPVTLVYFESIETVGYEFLREKQVQKWSREKKEDLIAGNLKDLREHSECKNSPHFRYFYKKDN